MHLVVDAMRWKLRVQDAQYQTMDRWRGWANVRCASSSYGVGWSDRRMVGTGPENYGE